MNNELINAAKDQAAREIGCASWADFKLLNRAFGSVTKKDADLDFILNRAMEIYAEKVAVEFAERLRRNYTNHLTGGGGWRYYGDKKEKVITTQELFNRFNTKP